MEPADEHDWKLIASRELKHLLWCNVELTRKNYTGKICKSSRGATLDTDRTSIPRSARSILDHSQRIFYIENQYVLLIAVYFVFLIKLSIAFLLAEVAPPGDVVRLTLGAQVVVAPKLNRLSSGSSKVVANGIGLRAVPEVDTRVVGVCGYSAYCSLDDYNDLCGANSADYTVVSVKAPDNGSIIVVLEPRQHVVRGSLIASPYALEGLRCDAFENLFVTAHNGDVNVPNSIKVTVIPIGDTGESPDIARIISRCLERSAANRNIVLDSQIIYRLCGRGSPRRMQRFSAATVLMPVLFRLARDSSSSPDQRESSRR